MNLKHSAIIYKLTTTGKRPYRLWALRRLVILSLLWLLVLPSCTDEVILPDDSTGNDNEWVDLIETKLPGCLGISLSNSPLSATRADDNTDPAGSRDWIQFHDGIAAEYDLVPGNSHHFVIIYEKNNDNGKPVMIIPMSFDEAVINRDDKGKDVDQEGNLKEDYIYNNITLTATSVVSSRDMTSEVSNLDGVKELLKDKEAFVVINFDCSSIYQDATTPTIDLSKDNASNIANLTRKQFLELRMKNYSIKAKKNGVDTEFFTMSNSVYADPNTSVNANTKSGIIIDYTITPQNVFQSETDAKDNPAISVYVERLAVKYTVGFDTSTYPPSDPGGDSPSTSASGIVINTTDDRGLPIYQVPVNLYTDLTIDFNPDNPENGGYKINSEVANAFVRVVGVGVSNLEKSEMLVKDVENYLYFTNWNDNKSGSSNHRSYWAKSPNYELKPNSEAARPNPEGYPHQFRLALETDTVASLFIKNTSGSYIYKKSPYVEQVSSTVNGVVYTNTYYREIGQINMASLHPKGVLTYKPFQDMMTDFNNNIWDQTNKKGKPFYSLENTYYDPGMKSGFNTERGGADDPNWVWEWKRAPYSVATNLLLLCQMQFEDAAQNWDNVKTLYRGQNDIFYKELYTTDNVEGVITSKLQILNEVMLNGGNAGFQIFDGKWAEHERGDQTTHLDKIAWNENGWLWLRTEKSDGTYEYRLMVDTDFRLIPAELAGGDGQGLIAPKDEIMGKEFRYYIAAKKAKADKNDPDEIIEDEKQRVQISFNHLVGLIHKIIGPIDVFTNGYMYYSVPISHTEQKFTESDINVNKESWRELGKIGVVRNNWYNITIGGVSGVGTPVHDVTQPIVPVMDIRRSYLNMGVQVLNWHKISQGGIPMN